MVGAVPDLTVEEHMAHRLPWPGDALPPMAAAAAMLALVSCARDDRAAAGDTAAGQTAVAAGTAQRTLYDRLGGKGAITAVVDTFVARVAADARINKKFVRSDIPRVKAMLVDQICSATGGPCTYTGRDMKEAHRNMGVTEGEFNALVEDLVAALNRFNVAKAEQDELLAILGSMKSAIVERPTMDTGTPLPANFKAAPPLGRDTARR
jgi:hemoglobin